MATTERSALAANTLDTLYRRHAPEVYRYSYAVLGNHADAEDVTQATFINALRALERGERPEKPSHWLIAIAHNLVRQRFRQQTSRPTEVELHTDIPNAGASGVDDEGPTVEELVGALGRIPASQREAIVMREFEGRPYAEIAESLGITKSALETLLFRARRSLADELENLVTCARAEEDLSRMLDDRLSRRERRRLREHVRSCPACARFEAFQHKQRKVLRGLATLPFPASLSVFKVGSGSTAAGLPTIGSAATASAGAGAAAATSGGITGSFVAAGVAAKAAAAVAAVAVAGGVTYEGSTHIGQHHPKPAPARSERTGPAAGDHGAPSGQQTHSTGTRINGNASQGGSGGVASAHSNSAGGKTGSTAGSAGASSPGNSGSAPGQTKGDSTGTSPGNSGSAPGQTKTDPANTSRGNSDSAQGQTKKTATDTTSSGKSARASGQTKKDTATAAAQNGKEKGQDKTAATTTTDTSGTATTGTTTPTETTPATPTTPSGNGNANGNTNGSGNGDGNGNGKSK